MTTSGNRSSNSGNRRRRRRRRCGQWAKQVLIVAIGGLTISWMTWNTLSATYHHYDSTTITTTTTRPFRQPSSLPSKSNNSAPLEKKPTNLKTTTATTTTMTKIPTTKILGFADDNYREHALRWYHRLTQLGYTEHVIVAVDPKAADFFRIHNSAAAAVASINSTTNSTTTMRVQWEALPYPPCADYQNDPRGYRRQIFGRRWAYIYEQLQQQQQQQQQNSILMTDVDNVFSRFVPMKEFEENVNGVDIFHAYSTSYPTNVFEEMGLTVCGGLSWLRASPRVIRFVGSLVNKCTCRGLIEKTNAAATAATDVRPVVSEKECRECSCDDQVALNELLWKGKHKIVWDRNITKPKGLKDWQWEPIMGISTTTRHRVAIWDRNFAYRGPLPETCPPNNWVAMPLYVDRSDVVEVWDALCPKS